MSYNIGNYLDWNKEAYRLRKHMILGKGKCFIDVGANIGLWTVYIAQKGYRVYSFEPYLPVYTELLKNVKSYPNVTAYSFALGEKEDLGELYLHVKPVRNSLRIRSNECLDETVTVHIRRLDDCIIDTPVGLIKIDTEGYEAPILRGAKEIILRDRPRLVIEVHWGLRKLRDELKILFDILKGYGYGVEAEHRDVTGQPFLIADSK